MQNQQEKQEHNHPFLRVIGIYRGVLSPQVLHTVKGLTLCGRVDDARKGLISALRSRGIGYVYDWERHFGVGNQK